MSLVTRLVAALGPIMPHVAAAPSKGASKPRAQGDTRVAARWTPADQAAFTAVRAQLDGPGKAHLDALKAQGKLADRDARGQTLVAGLAALTTLVPPAGAPYTAKAILGQALAHVADPAVIDQGDRNTCGATTVQYVMAVDQPAEYVRLLTGLAGGDAVTLRGGQAMALPRTARAADDSGRDDVERLVQTAFQDYGGDFRGAYSNVTDETSHRHENGGGPFAKAWRATGGRVIDWAVGKAGGAKGIAEGKVCELYRDVTGREARLVGDLPGGVFVAPSFLRGDVWGAVAGAVAQGRAVPVDVVIEGLSDDPGQQDETPFDQSWSNYGAQMRTHQVLVTKIADGRVHYRNPWGYETSLSEAAFRSRLTDAIIPA